ncbi:MAG: dipeptidase PepE [Bacteroidales bacterium]|jgi:dipeptidase E|nr:dipeptidase PepE [Bacteroidales bacterium]
MKLLLISNSTNYKEKYLGWCLPLIEDFLKNERKNILFFPYAGINIGGQPYPKSYDAYAERIKGIFEPLGFTVQSIHQAVCPVDAVNRADVLMVGGGNTFHLFAEIHQKGLIEPVRRKVMEGTPFVGWSAGANVACPRLCTTNDMPVVMPPSFNGFDLVPFQINPHYIDPFSEAVNDAIRHGGETRQVRLEEFLAVNPQITVAGLREASALWIENERITLKGDNAMRVMRFNQKPQEVETGAVFDFGINLLNK